MLQGEREEATPSPGPKAPSQKLTNQFNFCERASQTYNNPYRVTFSLFCLPVYLPLD